ncbi:hypothetical protein [Streptomyces sp. WAC01280]|uniref:hypothetical protein n=1 Tax=Streptomyces sp. WAC01280 TaxID=2487424 RepID=UPI000F78221D|nr:hypothetical protein [Streptomyces sp. WAC01280]RSS59779.1 hypothetical protein EF909_07925 [Streptomyces sp. WAC01280]
MGVITRAEDFYLPPPHLRADAWALIPPALRAVRWWEEKHQRRIPVTDGFVLDQQLYARINHGRWVADCTCMSAQMVTPADPRMWCVECGTGWWQVTFPTDVAAVEQQLAALPPAERNWWAHEDPTDPARPTLEV